MHGAPQLLKRDWISIAGSDLLVEQSRGSTNATREGYIRAHGKSCYAHGHG